MKVANLFTFIILASLSLTACGGGGNNTQVKPTAQITTTQQSATAISAPASEQMASGFLGASSSSSASAPLQFAGDITRGLFQLGDSGTGMQLTLINLCTSGSVNMPPANANSGTITFNNCEISGSGLFFNGAINFNAMQSGSDISITVTYNGFTVSDATQLLASMSGTLSMTLSYEGSIWSTTVSTSGFSVVVNGETIQMDDYSNTNVFDFDANENSVSFRYAVTSSSLGGTLIVTTDPAEGGAPLVTGTAGAFPYSGTIIIIGADNDRVRITINGGLATDSIVVEYALDGDGIYDDGMEILSWSEFEALSQYELNFVLN